MPIYHDLPRPIKPIEPIMPTYHNLTWPIMHIEPIMPTYHDLTWPIMHIEPIMPIISIKPISPIHSPKHKVVYSVCCLQIYQQFH